MQSREVLCSRIDDNLKTLMSELSNLRDRQGELDRDAIRAIQTVQSAESELTAAEAAGGGVARAVSRGSFTAALTVIGAVGHNRLVSEAQAKLRTAEAALARIVREQSAVRRRENDKLHIVRQQQTDWNRLDCFDLGFSHGVLNIR